MVVGELHGSVVGVEVVFERLYERDNRLKEECERNRRKINPNFALFFKFSFFHFLKEDM